MRPAPHPGGRNFDDSGLDRIAKANEIVYGLAASVWTCAGGLGK